VQPALTGSLAAVGLLAGWPQRAAVVRLAVPAEPPASDVQLPLDVQPASVLTTPPALVVGCVTAVLLGTLAVRIPDGADGLVLAAACWLAVCAVPLAFIDIAVSRLPDPLTAAACAGTALLLLLAAAAGGPGASWSALLGAVLGGLALAGFYLLLLIISPSGMSLGDVKLAASLGTLLAWFGWRVLIAGGAAGFLLGGLAGIVLLVSRRASRKQLIPFGPFMLAGAFLAVLAWPRLGA
jgi:leader peptidase (prepilin peptidase)/N-methyltransferase